jgi:Complex1_LYR-like
MTGVLRLYRKLLKIHADMPIEMKDLGNAYVKEEFKRHLYPTSSNVNQAIFLTFVESWKKYADDMKNPEIRMFGRRLTHEELQAMSKSQKETLNTFQDQYLNN